LQWYGRKQGNAGYTRAGNEIAAAFTLRSYAYPIAPKVAADVAYKNAKANTPHTARMVHDQALNNVMQALLKDDTDVYKRMKHESRLRTCTLPRQDGSAAPHFGLGD
jgi:hypothetical protein